MRKWFFFLLSSYFILLRACQINVPIGLWLQNNRGPCDTVKGHFILDETADNFTEEVFSTFGRLKSIEGCLYVRGFNGSNNLSFFSNLEEVVCKEKAVAFNLSNVIDILGPSLETMGFHSLKIVEGPGQIALSYEEMPISYTNQYKLLPLGKQCFFKNEMLFLARHPQFNGKMYQPCETDDPCFKLDYFKRYVDEEWDEPYWYWFYRFAEIPENCTTFVGLICIIGPYEKTDELFKRFANLTLLIGQIHVMGTLLDNLGDIFPKLESIYPYELTFVSAAGKRGCNQESFPNPGRWYLDPTPREEALQIVRVRLNRFLTTMSLPSLLPTRPIDISTPYYEDSFASEVRFVYHNYFPEPIPHPCQDFPQFDASNCGRFITNSSLPDEYDNIPPDDFEFITWLCAIVLAIIGVIFSIRTMILLQFSNATSCLPYSRQFINFSILITILIALENCIVYHRFFHVVYAKTYLQILPMFDSANLAHPFFQFIMLVLVSTKHTCLALLPFCYVDVIFFYRLKKLKASLYFCIVVTVLAIILFIYLHSQLFIAVRGTRSDYSLESTRVLYIPFVMNAKVANIFSQQIPSTKYIPYYLDQLDFSYYSYQKFHFDNITLEIQGNTFPDYVNVSDSFMLLVTVIFYLLVWWGFIHVHSNFAVLLLLYLQLSVNRIRYHIYLILVDDYCLRKENWLADDFYTSYLMNCYSYFRTEKNEPIMDETIWNILLKVIEKLPYLSYCSISFFCWKFARYESYLGPALHYREVRIEKKNSSNCNPADPSDIPLSTQTHV